MLKVAQVLALCLITHGIALPISASEAQETTQKLPITTQKNLLSSSNSVLPSLIEDDASHSIVWFIDFEQANNDIKRQLKRELKPTLDLKQYRNDIILLHKYRFRHVAGVNRLQTSAPDSDNLAD
jgi:hypothetical protein